MAKSTKSRRANKSPKRLSVTTAKPYPDYPLTPHPSGRWCKKIRGRLHYFGKLDDPQGALDKFNREWPYLSEGRTPPPSGDGLTVARLCDLFLNSKRLKMDAGELAERSFSDYYRVCALIVSHLGQGRRVDDLRPDDFERFRAALAKRYGVVTLRNEVNRCRVVFKYAYDQRLIDKPIAYGQSFQRPSAKMLRRARNEAGPRMFEVDDVRNILAAADPIMKAMVLLALNTGFGNTDVASLPQAAVNLDAGWIEFPRPKTEIPRRIPLWPETVEALRSAIGSRPKPTNPGDAGLCFLTSNGRPWVRTQRSKANPKMVVPVDPLCQRFARLLKKLGINGRRGFYSLRHTFETIGGESKDQVAVNAIMGHVDSSMAAVYRERISDDRLRAVVDVVRAWLWAEE